MKRIFISLVIALTSVIALSAQNIKVTGTVYDEKHEPIPGVSVLEVGTTNGTITDLDGNYSIEVPSMDKIQFSYVGYRVKQLNAVPAQHILNAIMEPDVVNLSDIFKTTTSSDDEIVIIRKSDPVTVIIEE